MSSNEVVRLQQQWRGFAAERSKAKRELEEHTEKNNAEITRLRDENARLTSEFDEKWRTKKQEIQEARDLAVMQELATGRSAQSILKELGSNNTVWIYDLRAKVQAAGSLPAGTNLNSPQVQVFEEQQQQIQQQSAQLTLVPDYEPEVLPGMKWSHHNHQGVVGWLISDNGKYIKKYGAEGTDFEGQWFVCDRDKDFIGGSRDLFEATPKGEITRKIKLLESLLDDSYTGRVKLVDNPYTD
jgi:hypothetical protein